MLRFVAVQMLLLCFVESEYTYPFQDPRLSWRDRVEDLVERLTLEEIVPQTIVFNDNITPAIPRLGIKPYPWATECLHGQIHTNGTAFPQSIGLAATFSPEVLFNMSQAISMELRARWNVNERQGKYMKGYGLSCFSPVINIMRHPLWGRNQETYGEDPFLSGTLVQGYVRGLQGDDPRYVRANAGCKHFDVHGGPENIPVSRFSFDAKVSIRDWRMTFLPAFKMCVEAGTYNLMCSYNSINGIPACANQQLLTNITRHEWGFKGYVVSDAGAITNIIRDHKYLNSTVDAAAASIKAGCNLELGSNIFNSTLDAMKVGKLTEHQIRENVKPLFYTRMRLGEFDPPEMVPFSGIGPDVVQSAAHRELAVTAAMRSFVLMKNDGGVLPLKKKIGTLGMTGPMAMNPSQQFGDYAPNVTKNVTKTPLEGLRDVADKVIYKAGCLFTRCPSYSSSDVKTVASESDVIVVCLGTGPDLEAEGQDRADLALPGQQLALLQDVVAAAQGKPVILLLFNAGPLDVTWAKLSSGVHVIMECFFPGQGTGWALARTFLNQGEAAVPAGRLPATWPTNLHQVPDITNYTMKGRTYRYYTEQPLYPFGFGLSYSTFSYSDLRLSSSSIQPGQQVDVSVTVKNNGPYDAEEVVQIYLTWDPSNAAAPLRQLVAFRRVFIPTGHAQRLTFTVRGHQMEVWVDDVIGFNVLPGTMTVHAGGQQPNQRTSAPSNTLSATFTVAF